MTKTNIDKSRKVHTRSNIAAGWLRVGELHEYGIRTLQKHQGMTQTLEEMEKANGEMATHNFSN